MDRDVFTSWVKHLERKMITEKRAITLILDKFSATRRVNEL